MASFSARHNIIVNSSLWLVAISNTSASLG
jgi:hypothetical protein